MVILTLNCGSSSAKYQVYDWEKKSVLAFGVVERIGLEYSEIEHRSANNGLHKERISSPTHREAIEFIIKILVDPVHGVIKDIKEIGAVGHRVLHGGEYFTQSVLVDDEVVAHLKEIIPLGPLHMPANIMGIEAARKVMGDSTTLCNGYCWHQTMKPEAFCMPPLQWYKNYNVVAMATTSTYTQLSGQQFSSEKIQVKLTLSATW